MPQAEHWYRKRAGMGGFQEEVYYSLLRVGQVLERKNAGFDEVRGAYLDAWESRPGRIEALVNLARVCRELGLHQQALLFSSEAVRRPYPEDDILFIDQSCWNWRAQDEWSLALFETGDRKAAIKGWKQLLDGELLPDDQRERVKNNLSFARSHAGGG